MFKLLETLSTKDLRAKINALDKSYAICEFAMDGRILDANRKFLDIFGYRLEEIKGKNHSIFVEPEYKTSREYPQFWSTLNRGEYYVSEFKRIRKDGNEIWIQASYNPILDSHGHPIKILKLAIDITEKKLLNFDYSGQIDAINKSQSVVHFGMDGTILAANDNFLQTMGYSLSEIQGKHHSMFVDADEKASNEYRQFWEALNRGEYQAAEYKRIGKGVREVYIQANYNPIFDDNGKPFKVVKYATDITQMVLQRQSNQHAQQMIEDSLEGIINAISRAAMQSANASAASTQTSANVQMVASGAEELNASVGEIAQSMVQSRNGADNAFENAVTADQAAQRLTEATQSMGGIVELIKNIADQINLLALNATIESARAGEAGKGFAVVANEVKNLANQATRATDDIAKEIEKTQTVSSEVVKCLDAIRQSIETVREYVTTTSSAVEEQRIVAREMSSNMQTAATSVASISESMGEIATATHLAEESTKHVSEATKQLSL